MRAPSLVHSLSLAIAAGIGASVAIGAPPLTKLPVAGFRLVERESGPVNYYAVVKDKEGSFIRARYRPPLKTAVLGYQIPEELRARAKHLRFRWRALTLPKRGNECEKGRGDSAAVIYVTWRRALRWYTLKYVWSSVGKKGSVCDGKRNPFVAQDTVILESGPPLNAWKSEDIELESQFRSHFADGDPDANVPDLLGVGLMSDGDQTESESAADYADFELH